MGKKKGGKQLRGPLGLCHSGRGSLDGKIGLEGGGGRSKQNTLEEDRYLNKTVSSERNQAKEEAPEG